MADLSRLVLARASGILLALLLTTGCTRQPDADGKKNSSEADTNSNARNADPKANLSKIYKAYKTACNKLGHSPDVNQLPTYLREHGDPIAIMQGIEIREQLSNPNPENREVVMAWEQNGKNDKYHALFYSGKIDVLTSDELSGRGIAVGKVAEQIAREDKIKRKADEEDRRKGEKEAAKALEERRKERDHVDADKDYVRIRNALPFGPEAEKFQSGENDWITRRAAVITDARKKGTITIKENFGYDEYVGSVPSPSVEEILDAIRRGMPAPVISGEKVQQKKQAEKK